ncbi:MAG: polysaccharide pyruvyl transferase family protein [Thermoleophilaceae bacterium]|nr:polysaccharide pyruvyl transferase family protein [Thermoleophilaceae bacterium]
MTLIRPFGNHGDELIWAGTRELLGAHVYREIGIDQLASAGGELAVISGGGAWSRRYNEFMPEVLAIAEMRFERVIVLPSTFEVSEDRVRTALENSNALIFARELESFEQIQGLCRARLAHDCAFFADLSDYGADGAGELNVFRMDDESRGLRALPADNEDISETAESLEAWLRTIERHAVVNTDRAHVMIAAALMGKTVKYAESSYFKVRAIAEYALGDYDVSPLPEPDPLPEIPPPADTAGRLGVARPVAPEQVTVVVVSRDQGDAVTSAIDSVLEQGDHAQLLVLDRNSRPQTRDALAAVAPRAPHAQFKFADRDSGAAASLRLAAELATSEYVMFLRDDMRLTPGVIEQLVAVLDTEPGASAVAPSVVDEAGGILHCGGWPLVDSESAGFEHLVAVDTGVTGWVPAHGTLFRRSALIQTPFADGMDVACQNADWVLRATLAEPESLRACPTATVVSRIEHSVGHGTSFIDRARAVRALSAHANFYAQQGRLLAGPLTEHFPELRDRDGILDATRTRLLLELVAARGTSWTLMEWINGGLEPLFKGDSDAALTQVSREHLEWLEQRNASLTGIENGGWWKLRNRLQFFRRAR